jgi:hypothetical protein
MTRMVMIMLHFYTIRSIGWVERDGHVFCFLPSSNIMMYLFLRSVDFFFQIRWP